MHILSFKYLRERLYLYSSPFHKYHKYNHTHNSNVVDITLSQLVKKNIIVCISFLWHLIKFKQLNDHYV